DQPPVQIADPSDREIGRRAAHVRDELRGEAPAVAALQRDLVVAGDDERHPSRDTTARTALTVEHPEAAPRTVARSRWSCLLSPFDAGESLGDARRCMRTVVH